MSLFLLLLVVADPHLEWLRDVLFSLFLEITHGL